MAGRILFIFLVFISGTTFAQPTSPPTDPDQPVPITGIEWLIGAGAILGAKKLLKRERKQ